MLNKFRSQQQGAGRREASDGRPRAITQVTSTAACEKWRHQVVRDIARKIEEINDPAITDFQIRELNDEINQLQKEKWMWETQLKNLGGTNYMRFAGNLTEVDGRGLGSHRGYKYYGRAKDLPGVKELFAELKPPPKQVLTSHELYKLDLEASYFGLRDEEDSTLLAYEQRREEEAKKNLLSEEGRSSRWNLVDIPSYDEMPSNAEIEAVLLEKRKTALLTQYG
jgi:pre-mRNA-splicing factor ISY1